MSAIMEIMEGSLPSTEGLSSPGKYQLLDKSILTVDLSYQRHNISLRRIKHIVENFNWAAFGVLSVSYRDDKYFVFDGHHRVIGVREIPEILLVPAMVYAFESLSEEAKAFVDLNSVRGPVTALQRFHAELVAGDKDAISLFEWIVSFDWEIPRTPTAGRGNFCCIDAAKKVQTYGEDHLVRCLTLMRKLYPDDSPNGEVLKVMSYLDRHIQRHHQGQNIHKSVAWKKIVDAGVGGLQKAMATSVELFGKGTRAKANGVICLVNSRRRSNKIQGINFDVAETSDK